MLKNIALCTYAQTYHLSNILIDLTFLSYSH